MSEKPLHETISPASALSPFLKEVLELSSVAIAYWAAVRLGLLLVARPEGIASIWPASGLALAILLLRPKRRWRKLLVVIFIINAAGNLNGGNSLPVSLGYALTNIAEAGFGAWALTALCGSKITFERTREVLFLLFVAVVTNAITALLGAAVSVWAFHSVFTDSWAVWWAADGLGIMLITPFIIGWVLNKRPLLSMSPRHIVEGVLIALSLALFAWLVFGSFTMAEKPIVRNYMVFPLLIWLVFRFSSRSVATALLLFSVVAVWNTLNGHGIFSFASQTRTEHLVSLQIFLAVLTGSGLLFSTIVTGRKQAEVMLRASREHIRRLVERLETVREEEHKHFADALHDELGQILTAIKIDLATVAAECPAEVRLKEKMDGAQKLLSDGILGVHTLCRELRPGALDDLGLKEALDGLTEDWKRRNDMECGFSADINEEALTDKIRTAVFRIVQEALTNVSDHAQASQVEVNLVADEQTLNFSVADNGHGMEPGAADKPESFGLLGMRERLEALGGELHIESSPGKGTRIEGTIPLPRKG